MDLAKYLILALTRIFNGQARSGDYLAWGFLLGQLAVMLTVATLTIVNLTGLSFNIEIFFLIPTLICAIAAFVLIIKGGFVFFVNNYRY